MLEQLYHDSKRSHTDGIVEGWLAQRAPCIRMSASFQEHAYQLCIRPLTNCSL